MKVPAGTPYIRIERENGFKWLPLIAVLVVTAILISLGIQVLDWLWRHKITTILGISAVGLIVYAYKKSASNTPHAKRAQRRPWIDRPDPETGRAMRREKFKRIEEFKRQAEKNIKNYPDQAAQCPLCNVMVKWKDADQHFNLVHKRLMHTLTNPATSAG